MLAVTEAMGTRPSKEAGIECDWCAYCLDEALLVRRWERERKETEKARGEQKIAEHQRKAREFSARRKGRVSG